MTSALSIKHLMGSAAAVAMIAVASGSVAVRADDPDDVDKAETMRHAEAHMRVQVEAGGITQAQMDERMRELREYLYADEEEEAGADAIAEDPPQTDEEKIAYYRRAEAEMTQAVNAGEITRADMQERLIGLRQRLFE
jgi:hypothetical protein